MSPIDPSSLLLAHVRTQALAWSRSRGSPRRPAADGGKTRTAPAADWSSLVLAAVRQIPPDDPDRPRKAFRVFLQAALARELGFTHLDDPAYLGLVDRVQETMEGDARLRESIARAAAHLLEKAR